MPNKDGTGPEGKGSKTGRQQGNCKDAEPNENLPRKGLGLGRRQRPKRSNQWNAKTLYKRKNKGPAKFFLL